MEIQIVSVVLCLFINHLEQLYDKKASGCLHQHILVNKLFQPQTVTHFCDVSDRILQPLIII
jgi:hypothetical protein